LLLRLFLLSQVGVGDILELSFSRSAYIQANRPEPVPFVPGNARTETGLAATPQDVQVQHRLNRLPGVGRLSSAAPRPPAAPAAARSHGFRKALQRLCRRHFL